MNRAHRYLVGDFDGSILQNQSAWLALKFVRGCQRVEEPMNSPLLRRTLLDSGWRSQRWRPVPLLLENPNINAGHGGGFGHKERPQTGDGIGVTERKNVVQTSLGHTCASPPGSQAMHDERTI
jgi:hypothetical protein